MDDEYYYVAHENCFGKFMTDRFKNNDKVNEKDAAFILM